jgi:long-chain acyl-CoA synthetase
LDRRVAIAQAGVVELLTAARSEDQQRHIAGGLHARGVAEGDRVALLTSSTGAMLSAILGSLRVGIVPVLLNSGLLDRERNALIADADPALVVDDTVLAELLTAPPTDLAPHPLARPMHYTSGTTGRPKGVWSGILDEHEAAALVAEEVEQWGFDPADRHLVCSPFHHSVAIRFGGGTLLAGGTVIVLGRFEAAAAARALVEHRPTTAFMVPAHLQRLFALDEVPPTPSLRTLVHAGAPCPAPLKERVLAHVGDDVVWEFYGSTEGQFTACSAPEWRERPGTVGRARRRRTLAADEDGTIWCTVPTYARFEYWRDAEKTEASWRPPDPAASASVGAHHAGVLAPRAWGAHEPASAPFGAFTVRDLGRLDDEGYLYLDGRRDDLIITGGVNVYPAEIERALAELDGVEQVAVFGVTDERWGQRVCAAVVGGATPEAVQQFAAGRLAGYKRPKDVFVVSDLPHTATGKLQRGRLPDLLGLQPG